MYPATKDSLGHEKVSYFQNGYIKDSGTENSNINGADVRDFLDKVTADTYGLKFGDCESVALSEYSTSENKGELNKTKSERRRTIPKKPHVVPDYVDVLLDKAGTPRFQCRICMKAFATKAHIKYHYFCNFTTSEKPYKCQTCGQSFIAKSHYEYHMRTHTAERPCVCSKCGRKYKHVKDLRRHSKTHSGSTSVSRKARLFHCDICYSDFTRKDNLMRHIENVHDQSKDIARELAKQSSVIDGEKEYQKLMKTPGNTSVLSSGNKSTLPTLTYTGLPNVTEIMNERLPADAATTTAEHAAKAKILAPPLINAATIPSSHQLSVIFDSKYNIVQVGYSQNQNQNQSKFSISLGNDKVGNIIEATETWLGNYSQESMMELTESSLQEEEVATTYKLGSEEIMFWEVFEPLISALIKERLGRTGRRNGQTTTFLN